MNFPADGLSKAALLQNILTTYVTGVKKYLLHVKQIINEESIAPLETH